MGWYSEDVCEIRISSHHKDYTPLEFSFDGDTYTDEVQLAIKVMEKVMEAVAEAKAKHPWND